MTGLALLLSLYVIVFVAAEVLHKRGCAARITRKFVHIVSGIISCFIPVLVNLQTAVIIGLVFSFFLLWAKQKKVLDSVHKIEADNVGAVLYPLGLIPCALIFWNDILVFQSSALMLGFSDAFACIFGRRYGKRGYNITGYKTLEGSLVFFGCTFAILLLMVFFSHEVINLTKIFYVIIGSLAVTIVEGMFGKGWDNLFIPVSSGLVTQLILMN